MSEDGFYKPSDIRRDGLLKIDKLRERDRLRNGAFPPSPAPAPYLGRNKIDFCPCCKRDMLPGEPPFDMKQDSHVDRCIHGSKIPKEYRRRGSDD